MTDQSPPILADEIVEVSVALDGERVDRALAMITGRSRSEITDLITAGRIFVNDVAVHVRHHRVSSGDVIRFDAKPLEERVALRPAAVGAIDFEAIYEDDSIIVIDKPAGLVVHPGAGHHDDTLASGLITRYPDLVEAAQRGAGDPSRPGIVHRLDKDTSGLLIVARTPLAYDSLVAQLASRSMGREYRALAVGILENEEGLIEAPIGRSTRFPTKMTVLASGREARTRYDVLNRYDQPIPLTLLHLKLETGRTHQIRVHLSAIGHPVIGDVRYGGRKKEIALERPFLHAERLRITHPPTQASMEWVSEIPADLASLLRELHQLDADERI